MTLKRERGVFYTNGEIIKKVIDPLFMNDLRSELKEAKGNEDKLILLHDKITSLKILDPACGSGNFLVYTYNELKTLELDISNNCKPGGKLHEQSKNKIVSIKQFYGMEIDRNSSDEARCSLVGESCNYGDDNDINDGNDIEQDELNVDGIIDNIKCVDSVDVNWSTIFGDNNVIFNYIIGNPPFVGYDHTNEYQRKQIKNVLKKKGKLDYITCFFAKGGEYIYKNKNTELAFVSTNSITQGTQIEPLWSLLLYEYDLEITFAHKSFQWKTNIEKDKASVTVVVIGLGKKDDKRDKILFDGNGDIIIPKKR